MIKDCFQKFITDREGGVIIYVALAMPVLVGGMGLGAEVGYRYYNQRLIQHAADFSAHAGAVRLSMEDTKPEIVTAATHVAVQSDYNNDLGTIAVNVPPESGAFMGDLTAVEVILTETRPRLFAAIFSNEPVTVSARAVAAVSNQRRIACMLALSKDSNFALRIAGSASIAMQGCDIASNSGFNMVGNNSSVTAGCIDVHEDGYYRLNDNVTTGCDGDLRINAKYVDDPYFYREEPNGGDCQDGDIGSPGVTTNVGLEPHDEWETWTHGDETPVRVMRFCNGLDARGIINFEPGVYIIEGGDLKAGGGTAPELNGENVTFFFTNGGTAELRSNAQLNLSAPDEGPFSGLLFFGGRDDPDAHIIQGTAGSSLSGAIYMPASEVTLTGNSTSTGCMQIIADTINVTGNSEVGSNCEEAGTNDVILDGYYIAVVE